MNRIALLLLVLFSFGLLAAQDLTPWQYVRHSAVDNNGQVHVRFNGSPSVLNAYEFYNWQNNAWNQVTLTNPEPLVYEALLPAVTGQTLKYRLRTSYDAMGETITAVNPAFLSADTFPPALNTMGYIADDPVGDSINVYFPNLDITGNWFGYTDTKLYCAMSNTANLFPTINSFTSYNLYFAGLAASTTAVADSSVYAMIYTFNIPGVIAPGLYKLGINPVDTSVVYEYLGAVQTVVSGGKLFLSCNISDLTADPGFGTWPPDNNSMGFISGSLRINIDLATMTPTFGIGDLSSIAQLIFENNSYAIVQNTPPVITYPNGDNDTVQFTYYDADQDFPLYNKLIFNEPDATFDFIPSSLDFSQPVLMTAIYNPNYFLGSGALIYVSDNNVNFVHYMFGDANEDETLPAAFTCKVYPNPFNPASGNLNIALSGSKNIPVSGAVYNLKGQLIKQLASPEKGSLNLFWDGGSDNQAPAANGIYLLKLKYGNDTISKKIIMVR